MREFLAELRRRNVPRVAAAYLIGAWVSIQVADVLLPAFGAPPWSLRVMTIVLALVFPLVIALTWTFEWTPAGFVRDTGDNIDRQLRVRVRRKLDYAILALSIVLVISIVVTRDWSEDIAPDGQPAPSVAGDRRSLAVLPFSNTSGKEDDLPLADGIAETLIHQLGQVNGLRVTARSSSFMFRERKADAQSIGRQLGVASILDGSVQRSGDRLRITAQLVDASSGTQLWTAQFDRKLDDVFEMQDEISQSVIGALQVSLLGAGPVESSARPDPGIEAYQAYLLGRRDIERDDPESALEHFERAIKIAPDYALAYAGSGDAWLRLAEYAEAELVDSIMTATRPVEMIDKADSAIRYALELDPSLGEAYTSLGRLLMYKGNESQAMAALERAIVLSPSFAPAFLWYSDLLRARSEQVKDDESLRLRADSMLQRAYELDPLSMVINQYLGHRAADQGHFEVALRHYRIAIDADPRYTLTYIWTGDIHGRVMGRLDEAARWFRRGEASFVGNWPTAWLARTHIDMLDIPAARAVLATASVDQTGKPWFLELAKLLLAEAELDGQLAIDIARGLLVEVPENYAFDAIRTTARRVLAYRLLEKHDCAKAADLYEQELHDFERGGPAALIGQVYFDDMADLGYLMLTCERTAQGQELLTALVTRLREATNSDGYRDVGSMAIVESAALALLQRNEEAIAALERAVDAGLRISTGNLTDHRRDPRFLTIRNSPRFIEIIHRLAAEAEIMRQSFASNPEVDRRYDASR